MAEKKKKRVGPIIFRIVLIVIAGLTVGLSVFSLNASGLVGNQIPMPFGVGMSVVLTDSMAPVLRGNDLIIVTEQDEYHVDDIVVYQIGRTTPTIHRIIEMNGDTVITKGDANNVPDDPISVEDIKAKLKFRIPFVGLIIKYIKTVPGTLLILVLAVFLLYRSRQKEREKDREELEDLVEEIKRLRSQQENSESAENKSDASGNTAQEAAVAETSNTTHSDTESSDLSYEVTQSDESPAESSDDSETGEEITEGSVSEASGGEVEESVESHEPSEEESAGYPEKVQSEIIGSSDGSDSKAADSPGEPVLDSSDTVISDNQSVDTDISEVKSILEELS